MNNPNINLEATTQLVRNSMNQRRLQLGLFLMRLMLACFVLSLIPKAFAVIPPPEGGYPGGNTAVGNDALFALTTPPVSGIQRLVFKRSCTTPMARRTQPPGIR